MDPSHPTKHVEASLIGKERLENLRTWIPVAPYRCAPAFCCLMQAWNITVHEVSLRAATGFTISGGERHVSLYQ